MDQKINFLNSRGENIAGLLNIASKADDLKNPIVIVCHGFSSNKYGSAGDLSNRLNKAGISSLRFDFWGHGESDGNFEDITLSEGVDDILAALKFLTSKEYSNIGLLGTSFGGACAIVAASKITGLKALGLRSPVADYGERAMMTMTPEQIGDWREKGFSIYTSGDGRQLKLKYNFYNDFKNNKGFEAAKNIKIPTCIIHGSKDESVPIELSKKLHKIIVNSKLHIISGADHRYTNEKNNNEGMGILVDFFKAAFKLTGAGF